MGVRFIVTPDTQQDLTDAYDWYEARRTGLGEDLLDSIDACFAKIRRTPEMYAIAFDKYRRALVRRFPYAIIYEICRARFADRRHTQHRLRGNDGGIR